MSGDKVIEFLDLISEYIESNINPNLKSYNTPTTPREVYTRLILENHKKVYDGSSYLESTCWDKNRKVIYYSNKGGYFYFRPNGKILKWSDFKKEV